MVLSWRPDIANGRNGSSDGVCNGLELSDITKFLFLSASPVIREKREMLSYS